jgi:hypothetical protein
LLKLKRDQSLLLYIDQGSDIVLVTAIRNSAPEKGILADVFESDSFDELSDLSINHLTHKIETGVFDITSHPKIDELLAIIALEDFWVIGKQ